MSVNIGVSGCMSMKNSLQDEGLLQRQRNTALPDRRLYEIRALCGFNGHGSLQV